MTTPAKPIWVDLATKDPQQATDFYSQLFGWEADFDLGQDAGGYGMLKLGGKDVAGIGPLQSDGQPTAWSVYIGTDDADAVAEKVKAAGGNVIAPPFDVFDAGRMAVFQDNLGAFFSVWQPKQMAGAQVTGQPGSLGWAELDARGVAGSRPFYQQVFGWTVKESEAPAEGMPPYIEWQADGESIAGAMEMPPMVPEQVPNFWLAYFSVADVDATAAKAKELGGQVSMPPMDYPGGRFAVLQDPQGATFAVMTG
jgi:uncharacterized protein